MSKTKKNNAVDIAEKTLKFDNQKSVSTKGSKSYQRAGAASILLTTAQALPIFDDQKTLNTKLCGPVIYTEVVKPLFQTIGMDSLYVDCMQLTKTSDAANLMKRCGKLRLWKYERIVNDLKIYCIG